MPTEIEAPGLVWVKDPVNVQTHEVTGDPPRRRHYETCTHFFVRDDGTMIGPPPYRANDEQMRTLPPCQTCLHETNAFGGSKSSKVDAREPVCDRCYMEMPVSGECPTCD